MKKLLVSSVFAISSLLAVSACADMTRTAQPSAYNNMPHHSQHKGSSYGHMNGGMDNTMMSQLNLSADQRAQIQAIRQNNRGNHQQNHDAIMQILTPEQQQKLTQMYTPRMNKGKPGKYSNQGKHMRNSGKHMRHQGHGYRHQDHGRRMSNQ